MKNKKLAGLITMAFVFIFLQSFAAGKEKVIVYYFYTDYRCATCIKFEKLTNSVVKNNFKKENKNGTIEFKKVNYQRKRNNHFVKKYKLYTKSIIISKIRNNKQVKWKNLSKIWELIYNEKSFKKYIRQEIKFLLKK